METLIYTLQVFQRRHSTVGPASTCLHSLDKQESILEEKKAQVATGKPEFMFPVRAIHPVTNMTPYLSYPDKNRSIRDKGARAVATLLGRALSCSYGSLDNCFLSVGLLHQGPEPKPASGAPVGKGRPFCSGTHP